MGKLQSIQLRFIDGYPPSIKSRARVNGMGRRSVVDFFQGVKFNRRTWVLLPSKTTNSRGSQGWPDLQWKSQAAVGQ